MRNKDSGARTGLAPATNPLSVLSPVEVDRKRRRRRTDSTATDASSNITMPNSSLTGPIESPVATPTAPVPNAQTSVPATPPTPCVLPPTPIKRQQRTPSKVSIVVTEGEDSQDDSIILQDEPDGQGTLDNESSSKKKKPLVKKNETSFEILLMFVNLMAVFLFFYYNCSHVKKGRWKPL